MCYRQSIVGELFLILAYSNYSLYLCIKEKVMTFQERKQKRMEHFENNVKGWKMRPCTACNGSGRYDHNGSPKCGACNGSGKERYKPKTN
jgi:hypothetical protein